MSDSLTDQIQSAFERSHHVYESIGAARERVDALVEQVQQMLVQQGALAQSSPKQLNLYKRLLAVQSIYTHVTSGAWDAMQLLDTLREEE